MTEYLKSIDFIEKTILEEADEMFNSDQLAGSIHGVPVGLYVGPYSRPDHKSATANKSYYPTLMSGGSSDSISLNKWCPEDLFDSLFQKVSVTSKNSKRKTRKTRK